MDVLLGKITQQAMNYAIRSGITITASYAIQQSSRLLRNVEGNEKEELQMLQERLEGKIRIISPAIDMIELISARGNTTLESAVSLTQSLRWDIQTLGQRLALAANQEELVRKGRGNSSMRTQNEIELRNIVKQIKKLLVQIEDAVPLINLAITTSGVSLSASLPATISPSRLLQASTFLTAGDSQYSIAPARSVQIGPTFTLSLYMLFSGYLRPESEEDVRQSTWKEVIHKARVKLIRVPLPYLFCLPREPNHSLGSTETSSNAEERGREADEQGLHVSGEARTDEFAYQILIIEDLDDDRMHDDDDTQPSAYEGVELAGFREAIPVHQISKIFYADTGKILNIGGEGESNKPVLLLKRDIHAIPPRKLTERYDNSYNDGETQGLAQPERLLTNHNDERQSLIDAQINHEHRQPTSKSSISPDSANLPNALRIPSNLDPEWLAFEVYVESLDSDTESEVSDSIAASSPPLRAKSLISEIVSPLTNLHLNSTSSSTSPQATKRQVMSPNSGTPERRTNSALPTIRTSLSLFETLLRLVSLQQFQQTSHLSIPDELLNFFLSEAATTGAATGESEERRRLRAEACRRVGFDPYDESPIKRRGEDYQYRGGNSQAGWNEDYAHSQLGGDAQHDTSLQTQEYNSPTWDSGYDTHPVGTPSHNPSRPPYPTSESDFKARRYLLKDHAASRSNSHTPDRSMPPLQSWKDGHPVSSPRTPIKNPTNVRPATPMPSSSAGWTDCVDSQSIGPGTVKQESGNG